MAPSTLSPSPSSHAMRLLLVGSTAALAWSLLLLALLSDATTVLTTHAFSTQPFLTASRAAIHSSGASAVKSCLAASTAPEVTPSTTTPTTTTTKQPDVDIPTVVGVAVTTPLTTATTASTTSLDAAAAAVTSTGGVEDDQGQTMLDESIFKFNKLLIDSVYNIICLLYPVTSDVKSKRNYARFYVLETVARVPYFAYLSVLHLRETFGVRYDNMRDQMRTHYAQADNELHHLLIMEALGGNESPVDRFVAQSAAFMYYWYVIMIYSFNEPAAYHLSELIEDHAYDTYNRFLTENADSLKGQPVPDIARQYYEFDNPFMFDLFCTVQDQQQEEQQQQLPTPAQQSQALSMIQQRRSRKLESLYDVFRNVRDDEKEHWKTLCNLVQYNDMNAVSASEVQSTQPAPPVVS